MAVKLENKVVAKTENESGVNNVMTVKRKPKANQEHLNWYGIISCHDFPKQQGWQYKDALKHMHKATESKEPFKFITFEWFDQNMNLIELWQINHLQLQVNF